jgi:hypothetical protein
LAVVLGSPAYHAWLRWKSRKTKVQDKWVDSQVERGSGYRLGNLVGTRAGLDASECRGSIVVYCSHKDEETAQAAWTRVRWSYFAFFG